MRLIDADRLKDRIKFESDHELDGRDLLYTEHVADMIDSQETVTEVEDADMMRATLGCVEEIARYMAKGTKGYTVTNYNNDLVFVIPYMKDKKMNLSEVMDFIARHCREARRARRKINSEKNRI